MLYLIDPVHLMRAARLCMRRTSSPGADGMTWAQYRRGLRGRLAELSQQLHDGQWQPGPMREVQLNTYTGKAFPAAIPTVTDRIVHRAMRTAIDPLLETRLLADWVSAYRPGRSRITALTQAGAHLPCRAAVGRGYRRRRRVRGRQHR